MFYYYRWTHPPHPPFPPQERTSGFSEPLEDSPSEKRRKAQITEKELKQARGKTNWRCSQISV